MDKKSLGTFIALLRKEKGLTQKQLAELLNVSDKTVSHWECDETSPDIYLLPELSKALGVTVDELLSGEKKKTYSTLASYPHPQKNEGIFDKVSKKASSFADKIKDGDITDRYRYFRMLSLVGTIIAAVVLLNIVLTTVLSAWFIASRLLSSVVVLIGSLWTIVLSLLFTLGGRFLFSKKLIPETSDTPIEKDYIYKANRVSFNNLLLLFSVFPLALTGVDILPVALNFVLALAFVVIIRTICVILLTKKGIFKRNEKEMLLIRKGFVCLILLAAGAGIHLFAAEIYHPAPENIVFHSAEEFKAYMETPKEKPEDAYRIDGVSMTVAPTIMLSPHNDSLYEEVFGNEEYVVQAAPDEEEFVPTDIIVDYTGKKVVSFKVLNNEVYDYSYYENEGTFHVITYEAKLKQKDILVLLDDGLGILMHVYYAAVIVGCFISYLKQKKELTEK